MKKKLKVLLVSISIVGLAIFIGCASFQDALTPAHKSPIVEAYMDANDVPLPPHKRLIPWWDSLFDLKVIDARIEFIHKYRQMDEDLRYTFAKNVNLGFAQAGESLKQTLFSPKGALGLLLPILLTSPFAVLLGGRYVKSPHEKELEEKEKNGELNGNNS